MKLRYLIVFVLGMICMYWLVRADIIHITVMGQTDNISSTMVKSVRASMSGAMFSGTITSGAQSTGVVLTGTTTGSVVMSGVVSSGTITSGSTKDTNNSSTGIAQIVDVVNPGTTKTTDTSATNNSTASTTPTAKSYSSNTKIAACAKPNGSYNNPLQVGWNETATASTRGYIKLGNFLHYVVNVSNGARYYFYYNCTSGESKNIQNLTNTKLTRVILSRGSVYLR